MAQVINMGPWKGDSLQQMSQRHAAVQQLQAAGAQFMSDANQAHKHADARNFVVAYIPGAQGGHGGSDKPIYASVDRAKLGGGGTGGGGGGGTGGGSPVPAQAPGAVQAGLPQPTGGGMPFQIGAAQVQDFLPARADSFEGHDSFTPQERLGDRYTPLGVNWDSFEKFGSFCVRRGTAKLNEDIHTIEITEGSITCIALADFTASTDYITFTKPDTDTHAFWFDTTGSDSEPAGSSGADASTEVDISGDTTASDVATTLAAAINTADIGLVAIADSGTVRVFAEVGGATWGLTETVTDGSFAVSAPSDGALDGTYRGISISRLPGNYDGPDLLLLTLADAEIGSAPSAYPQSLHVIKAYPRWGRPLKLTGWPGPQVENLTQIAGPEVRVTVDYTNVFNNGTEAGKRAQSVVELIVRYSPYGYPLDVDGQDWIAEEYEETLTAADRAAWTGASTTKDTSSKNAAGDAWQTGDVCYVTAWAVTRMGYSNPSYARLEIT